MNGKYVRHDLHSTTTAPGAGTVLLVQELDRKSKLMKVRVGAGEGNVFDILIRNQDGSSAVQEDFIRLPSSGSAVDLSESKENPILEIGGSKEIVIQNRDAGSSGVDYDVAVSILEKKG